MIDKTAIIHPSAQIADDAIIGPYVVIGENVKIGSKTRVIANAYIENAVAVILVAVESKAPLSNTNLIIGFARIIAPTIIGTVINITEFTLFTTILEKFS